MYYWGMVVVNLCVIDIWIGEVEDFGKGYGIFMMELVLD